jgi:hypothetical protein
MYNQELAHAILRVVDKVFPEAMPDLQNIKSELPKFSALDDNEWFKAMEALHKDGCIEALTDPGESTGGISIVWRNIKIMPPGRERLKAKLTRHTEEWWKEEKRLAELLKQWEANRDSAELQRQVLTSMERLGLVVSRE